MSTARPIPSPTPRRRIRTVVLFVGAALFLFEEWIWIGCNRIFRWLGRFGLLRWVDKWLLRLAPAAALMVLCIPIALLFPVKIAGLWMIASGRFFTGCAVMLAAKICSTAIIARIFLTCRSQLLEMPWFARLHNLALALRGRIHQWLAEQDAWRDVKRTLAGIRRRLRSWIGARDAHGNVVREGVLLRWRRTRRRTVMATVARRNFDDERR